MVAGQVVGNARTRSIDNTVAASTKTIDADAVSVVPRLCQAEDVDSTVTHDLNDVISLVEE